MTSPYLSWPDRIAAALKLMGQRSITATEAETLQNTIRAAGDQIARLDSQVFVPGQFQCARCKSGVTFDPAVTTPLPTSAACPKGCGPMWRVSWQRRAEEAEEKLLELEHRKPEQADGK